MGDFHLVIWLFGVIRSVGNQDVKKEDDEDEEEYVQDVEEDGMVDGEEGIINMAGLENPKCHSWTFSGDNNNHNKPIKNNAGDVASVNDRIWGVEIDRELSSKAREGVCFIPGVVIDCGSAAFTSRVLVLLVQW